MTRLGPNTGSACLGASGATASSSSSSWLEIAVTVNVAALVPQYWPGTVWQHASITSSTGASGTSPATGSAAVVVHAAPTVQLRALPGLLLLRMFVP